MQNLHRHHNGVWLPHFLLLLLLPQLIVLLWLPTETNAWVDVVLHPRQRASTGGGCVSRVASVVIHASSSSSGSGSSTGGSTSMEFAMNPTGETARQIIRDQLGLSLEQHQQLAALAVLVVDWNSRINLISRRDCTTDVVFGRHILPSLAPCGMKDTQRVFPLPVDSDSNDKEVTSFQVVDVGTGGGFPGLPLAIAYPQCSFLLVDSVGKKLAAVQDMANQLGLTNVKTHHGRAEVLQSQKFDLCVGRSVAAIPTYCFWIQNLLKKDTGKLVYIIGGEIEEEILQQVESDQPIDDLLQYPGVSDKRVLVFPQAQVRKIAAASGEKIHQGVSLGSSTTGKRPMRAGNQSSKANTPKPKSSKGQWTRRDPTTAPKQRGYENFKRFDSLSKE